VAPHASLHRATAFGDLKNDYLFHHIFGEHPDLAAALLNDLLDRQGPDRIVHLGILPPEQWPPLAGAKLSILDLKARDQAGNTFVVEIQVLPMVGFINRIVFNACRADEGQFQAGQAYADLTPVIAVSLCDFLLWPDDEQDLAPVRLATRGKRRGASVACRPTRTASAWGQWTYPLLAFRTP
jgi:predicted transposase/invertase (TIGR01784 family)